MVELLGIDDILLGITSSTNSFYAYILKAIGFFDYLIDCLLKDKYCDNLKVK